MRKRLSIILVIVLAAVAIAFGARAVLRPSAPWAEEERREITAAGLDQRATPADRRIEAAQGVIKKAPASLVGYNALAAAFMQKARETGDFGYHARAEEAIKRSYEVAPDNQGANRLRGYLLLAYHRFAEAREVAARAVAQNPRDYEAYGALVDAHVELGQYDEAKKALQAMLDVRPYAASYARASYLRSLHGDSAGAIEAMRLAADSADPGDPESLAWCLVHLGDELMNAGEPSEAEREYDRALYYFPDYPLALNAKARARAASGDTTAAAMARHEDCARTATPATRPARNSRFPTIMSGALTASSLMAATAIAVDPISTATAPANRPRPVLIRRERSSLHRSQNGQFGATTVLRSASVTITNSRTPTKIKQYDHPGGRDEMLTFRRSTAGTPWRAHTSGTPRPVATHPAGI